MESPDCPERHPPLKSENEELNESLLKELIEFFRETVEGKLAEGGYQYTAPHNVERNYWVYIVEVILGIDNYDVSVQSCNADEPDTDKEDENERANRQAEELLREEEARNASQQKISSSKTLKKKKKKMKQKAKQGKESKADEVDEHQVGKGARDEGEKVNNNEEEKANGDEEEAERVKGYEGEKVNGDDGDRINEEGDRVEGYKGDRVNVDEGDRVNEDEAERVERYEGEKVNGYEGNKVNENEAERVEGYKGEKVSVDEEEKVNGDGDRVNENEGDRVEGYKGEKVNVNGGDRINEDEAEYEGEKVHGDEGDRVNEAVNVDEEERADGYEGDKENVDEEQRVDGYEGDKDVANSRLQNVVSANSRPVGIINMGATYYMNAALHFLLRPSGRKRFEVDKLEAANNGEDTDIVNEFHKLWGMLLSNNGGRPIHLESFKLILSAWSRALDPNSTNFICTQQHDAQEFLQFIFNHLLNRQQFTNAFNFQIVQTEKCLTQNLSKDVENSVQSLNTLCITDPQTGMGNYSYDLLQLLANHFGIGDITKIEWCKKCGKRDMLICSKLLCTSEFLIMVLPRAESAWKLKYKLCNIPHDLDLKPYFASGVSIENSRYELCAVMAHYGNTATSGQYVTSVLDNTSRTWYKFNDTHVSNLINFQEEAGDDAFMLLYKKVGGGQESKEKESCSADGRHKDSNEEKGGVQNTEKESSSSEFVADERDKGLSQNRAEEKDRVAFVGDDRDEYLNENTISGGNADVTQDAETSKQIEEVRQSEENTISEENINIAQHKETVKQIEEPEQATEIIFSKENVSGAQDTETVKQIEKPEQAPEVIFSKENVSEAQDTETVKQIEEPEKVTEVTLSKEYVSETQASETVKQTQEPKQATNVDEVQDRKTVENSKRLKQPRASADSGPVGIRNLGSTCYMNAALQFLLRPMGRNWLDLDIQETAATDMDTDVIRELHQLWELLLSNNGGSTIEPESTKLIQSAWNRFKHPSSPNFEPAQQEDAEEFMEFVLTHLLNGRQCITAFYIQYFKYAYCRVCHKKDVILIHHYPSLRLGLKDIGRGAFNLADLFINKFQNSVCSEYFCGLCQEKDMGNYNRFVSTSEFFIIWLPRTTRLAEVGNWKRQYKLQDIPHDLDLNPFFHLGPFSTVEEQIPEELTRYKLHAVLTHFGQSMVSGHYIAAVLDGASGTWFKFDDDRVTRLVDFQQEVGDDAYMLLYRNLAMGEQNKVEKRDSEKGREQIKEKESGSAEVLVDGRDKSSEEETGEAQNEGKRNDREENVHQSQNTNNAGLQEHISDSQDTNKIVGIEPRNETIGSSKKSRSRRKKNGARSREDGSAAQPNSRRKEQRKPWN